MIHKIDKKEFNTVRPLFDQPHLSFVIEAVIAGNSNGDIWVDDPSHPQTVVLWDKGPRYYLAGRADNQRFNEELNRIVNEIPLGPYLIACCTSTAWDSKLSGIFAGRLFKKRQRCLYRLNRLQIPNWRDQILPGFSVARIDKELLKDEKLVNLDDLAGEIRSMWPSVDGFLENAFGFCMLHNQNEIACWCTAEYVSGSQLGIGIETVNRYERQSLATLTASAFAEHCLSNRLEAHWDSWADNIPSVRVAEKVGFGKVLDYYVYQGQ